MPSVAPARYGGLLQLNRRNYAICAVLLLVVIGIMPASFVIGSGAAAGWLLLFSARIRDIGKRSLNFFSLPLVGLEMFNKEIFLFISNAAGKAALGYYILVLILAHLALTVVLGLQRTAVQAVNAELSS